MDRLFHTETHTYTRCNLTDKKDGYDHENVIVQLFKPLYLFAIY